MSHIMFIVAVCVALAAVIGILVMIGKKQAKAKRAALVGAYQELLSAQNLQPSLVDQLDHRILAIDTVRNIFAAVQQEGDKISSAVVPLNEVRECSIKKSGLSVDSPRGGKNVTEEFTSSISLLFGMRHGDPVEVPVYTEIMDGITERADLLRIAEKWQQLVRVTIGQAGKALA